MKMFRVVWTGVLSAFVFLGCIQLNARATSTPPPPPKMPCWCREFCTLAKYQRERQHHYGF